YSLPKHCVFTQSGAAADRLQRPHLRRSRLQWRLSASVRRFPQRLVEVSASERKGTMTTYFMFRALLFSVLLGVCATGYSQPLATQDASPRTFVFALIGDLGYLPVQEPWLANLLTELNQTPLAFVVHVGDLGAPRFGSCTNEFWTRRLAQFQASAHPLIYTPGDNEWTDCHEQEGAPGYEPLERP